MMKKSKIMALTLVALGLTNSGGVVLADTSQSISGNVTDSTSGSSTVQYEVPVKYTVTIPTTITLTDDDGEKGAVSLSNAVTIKVADNALKIANGKKLTVAVTTGQEFKLQISGVADSELNYTLYQGTSDSDALLSAGAVIAEATPDATADVEQGLYFETTGAPKYAGTYTGTLNFTIDPNAEVT
ncbi:MAG: hypothetical protein LBS33_04035 [Streptococcaceae bacterium]|jgi:hypothetical protein|nr:hypothetical protein [Streptococcaceae bacterium]